MLVRLVQWLETMKSELFKNFFPKLSKNFIRLNRQIASDNKNINAFTQALFKWL